MRRIIVFCVISFVTLLDPGAPFAQAQTPSQETPAPATTVRSNVRLNVELGGQTRFTSDDRWTKFEQFRDIPKNFTLTYFDFEFQKDGSPWSVRGTGRDAGQLDQRYRIVLEKFGRIRTELRYDGFPNFISRLVKAPYFESTPGRLIVPDTFQSALQAAADSSVPTLVNDLLINTPFADLQLRRQRFQVLQEFTLTNSWSIFAHLTREHRSGRKPIGLGTYERTGTPTGGFFTILGDELPEPLNYRTTAFRAGLTFQNRHGLVRFEYAGSWFENNTAALIWDNPFSLTDQEGSAPAGAANRWRFSIGQLDLYPGNSANTFTVSGRLDLPCDSFFSALAAWSFWRQNDAFLPWTLNTAVITGVPAGVVPTDASTLARSSLDGRINLFNSDVVLGTRRWEKVLLTGRYRVYRYNNDTPQLPLPGYVAFGDSFWRTNIAGVPFTDVHEPNSFMRQQTSIEGVWKPSDVWQLKLEPFWEGWNREHRQVNRTNEWGVRSQMIYKPVRWFNGRMNYRYASRDPQLYEVGPFEFSGLTTLPPNGFASGLRMFDQAHRNRNEAGLVLNLGGSSAWSISANYNYLGDVYDQNFFGLGKYLRGNAGVDVNYAPSDRYGFVAYYNRDRVRYNYRNIAKGAGASTWVLDNEWDRDTRDLVDSFGVGLNVFGNEERLEFNLSYDFSLAKQTITTQNPNTIQANMANDAMAFPWPDVKSRFHEVRLESSYQFRPNTRVGIRYVFEPYRLSDFAWDIMQPYMFGFEAPENDARRMVFLDSRYSETDAHLLGFFVRYAF